MAFRAKTRDEASAYFAGWYAAEFDHNGARDSEERPSMAQHLGNVTAYDAGYAEYNAFAKEM